MLNKRTLAALTVPAILAVVASTAGCASAHPKAVRAAAVAETSPSDFPAAPATDFKAPPTSTPGEPAATRSSHPSSAAKHPSASPRTTSPATAPASTGSTRPPAKTPPATTEPATSAPATTPPATLAPARLRVTAGSPVTDLSVPGGGNVSWVICVPVTFTITNAGAGVISQVKIVPTIQVTSRGGQVDTLVERPEHTLAFTVSVENGKPASRSAQACGILFNNAGKNITYVGTGHLVGGTATGTAKGTSSVLSATVKIR